MKAFIFDMDGTLLDTNGLWWELPERLLAREGIACPEALRPLLGKLPSGVMTKRLIEAGVLPYTNEAVWPIYFDLMKERYQADSTWCEGAEAFVKTLVQMDIPCCVATATPLDTAMVALQQCGVLPYLSFAQSTSTVGLDKSKPAFFEAIAAQLGVPIDECVVVEDALYAMRGAKQAGATVWAIADRYMSGDWPQIEEVADAAFQSYAEMAAALNVGQSAMAMT